MHVMIRTQLATHADCVGIGKPRNIMVLYVAIGVFYGVFDHRYDEVYRTKPHNDAEIHNDTILAYKSLTTPA